MYENTNLGDLMYNAACKAIEKKVLELIDEDKIIDVSMSIIEPKLIDMIKKMD